MATSWAGKEAEKKKTAEEKYKFVTYILNNEAIRRTQNPNQKDKDKRMKEKHPEIWEGPILHLFGGSIRYEETIGRIQKHLHMVGKMRSPSRSRILTAS